jgi:hypothetical protein
VTVPAADNLRRAQFGIAGSQGPGTVMPLGNHPAIVVAADMLDAIDALVNDQRDQSYFGFDEEGYIRTRAWESFTHEVKAILHRNASA